MASYSNGSNGAPSSSSNYTPFVPSSLRQNHPQIEEDDPIGDCMNFLQRYWQKLVRFWNTSGKRATIAFLLKTAHQLRRNLVLSRLFSFPHVLVVLWVLVLMWGERWIFHTKVESCHWSNWEKWVREPPLRCCSSCYRADHEIQTADNKVHLAFRDHAPSPNTCRRPPVDRSFLISRPAMAPQFVDCHHHR